MKGLNSMSVVRSRICLCLSVGLLVHFFLWMGIRSWTSSHPSTKASSASSLSTGSSVSSHSSRRLLSYRHEHPTLPVVDETLRTPLELVSVNQSVLSFGRRCTPASPCRLAVFTAIYKEDIYLKEWIVFHLLHGVQHFFIADMLPRSFASAAWLRTFIDAGIVTLSHKHALWAYGIPRLLEQIDSIRMMVSVHGHRTEWAWVGDADEFFVSETYGSFSRLLSVKEAEVDIIRMPWYMFGGDGHIKRPPPHLPVSGAYTIRTEECVYDVSKYIWERFNGKSVFRAACFETMANPHDINLNAKCRSPPQPVYNENPGYHLNHYHLKSYEDFYAKRHATGFTGLRSNFLKYHNHSGHWNSQMRNFKNEWDYYNKKWCCAKDIGLVAASKVLYQRMREVPDPGVVRDYLSSADPDIRGVAY